MISIGNLQINKLCLGDVEVTRAYLGDVQVYGSTPQPVEKYMTITVDDAAGETVISPKVTGSITPNLQYRVNNGNWNDFIVGTTADIHVVAGDVVQWKGVNENGVSVDYNNYLNFVISGNTVALSGNVMSLIDGVGETLVIPNDYCFCHLFRNSAIKTVSSYFLPATTLANRCYSSMFSSCTSLVNAPALPATTLAKECYNSMFNGCTSLTTAPELPATTIADGCYRSMFYGCTALTTAPVLPATTLANMCYAEMFYECTSLVNAPELPATTLKDGCYYYMFYGCTSLTTAPELPATTIAGSCYENMFQGCSSLVDAPALPATKLADRCYLSMFYGCSSIVNAPVLPATTLANLCYDSMFQECTSLTTAPQLHATTLVDSCYKFMFYGCTALTTAPALPATTLANNCYFSMFSGCTSLTAAPVLPATKLADSCYLNMFYNCKNMNYVKCLATDITATNAIKNWLYKVAVSGTFVKPAGVTYPTGISGIPEGWTIEEIVEPTQEKYLTMTVDESNSGETTISPTVTGSLPNLNLQYRINNGDWTDFIVGTTADIHLTAGNFVQFKGVNESGLSIDYDNYLTFAISGNPVALSGNIMSLIDGVGETLVIPNKLCFYYLFYNSEIKTVSSDFLPATTLKEECYRSLFAYCRSLTQAPALPATTLESYCYSEMFGGCTALTTAPELPATTLVDSCYNYMFIYCSSLNYVKCHATDNISTSTIFGWLSGVSSTGTFVKPAGVTYETGDSGIPQGWTVEEIVEPTQEKYMTITVLDGNKGETTIKPTVTGSLPNLNLQYRINNGDWNDFIVGTTADIHVVFGDFVQWKGNNTGGVSASDSNYLKFAISGNNVALSGNVMSLIDGVGDSLEIPCNYCFYKLFESSQVKTVSSDFLHAITLKTYCYYSMFRDCTSLTTAPALPATTIAESCYRYMFSGCTSLTAAPVLPATNLAVGCYQGMFQRCSNLIQSPALPATILKDSCYKFMFSECTSLTTAPELPATTLVDGCYHGMFDNCRKLNYVKSLAVEGLNSFNALRGWLSLVSNTGTFVKPAGVSYETGASGIPSGWNVEEI